MTTSSSSQAVCPKLLGADIELGNFVRGGGPPQGTGSIASQRLLREIDGLPRSSRHTPPPAPVVTSNGGSGEASYSSHGSDTRHGSDYGNQSVYGVYQNYHAQDWGRRFLPNGSCVYIDLSHLEICVPETLDAREHVAAIRAMHLIARDAQERANAGRAPDDQVVVLCNNSDGQGNAYGSHLGVMIAREAYDGLTQRRLHHLLFLASYQVSSILFTGQGKVGSENLTPACDYQIAQRADFFETLMGQQTTYFRPLVNLRDEALVGTLNQWTTTDSRDGAGDGTDPADRYARLHIIFYDNALCQTACYLRAGVMQVVLAMIERGEVDPALILDDPVAAVVEWSHDPDLRKCVPLAGGKRRISAVEWQLRFAGQAVRFVDSGACEGIVPGAREIVDTWTGVLGKLEARRFDELTRDLDWVLKREVIGHTLAARGLAWDAPEARHMDQLFGSLGDGIFWRLEEQGHVNRIVTDAEIERLVHLPPADTRAWGRGHLLANADPRDVTFVDWDKVFIREKPGRFSWTTTRRVDLSDPLGSTEKALRGNPRALLDPPAADGIDTSTGAGATPTDAGSQLAVVPGDATHQPKTKPTKGK